ncbi:MAG: DUF1634 domain-containing protein [Ktedonobacterales bacterium]|nr:DUF1634 domain-containing protein [Ktedonobacterales bacterium]
MTTPKPTPETLPTPASAAEAKLGGTEILISTVLRGGVFLSGGVTLLGVVLLFIQQRGQPLGDVTKVPYPHTLGAVFTGVGHGSAIAIIMLGLLLLIATPVTRIAVSILAFANERDWRYVGITTVVLVILLISFLLGKAG